MALIATPATAKEPTPAPELAAPPLLAPENRGAAERSAIRPASATATEEILPAPAAEPTPAPVGPLAAERHPWARHGRGAWRRQRIVTESFDDRGLLTGRSVTLRTETLVAADARGYTLRVDTVVDVGGQRLPGPRQELSFGLLADTPDATPRLADDGSHSISLAGAAIPCERWEWSVATERGEVIAAALLSDSVAPHVLTTERAEVVDGVVVEEVTSRVVRTGAPLELGSRIVPSHHVAESRSGIGGDRSERFAVHTEVTPGGAVSESVADYDAAGRRIRWTVSRVTAFGSETNGVRRSVELGASRSAEPIEIRPRRWLRMLRRGIDLDDLDDLDDDIDLDDLEDLVDD